MNLIAKIGITVRLRPFQFFPYFMACLYIPMNYFAGKTVDVWVWGAILFFTILALARTSMLVERRHNDSKNSQ